MPTLLTSVLKNLLTLPACCTNTGVGKFADTYDNADMCRPCLRKDTGTVPNRCVAVTANITIASNPY